MGANEIALELYSAWQRDSGSAGFYDELPSGILRIPAPELRRVYILFYFAVSKRLHCMLCSRHLGNLEGLGAEKKAPSAPSSPSSPENVLNPAIIAAASPAEIKRCLKNKISIKTADSLKKLGEYIVQHGDIPDSCSTLMTFSCIGAANARAIVYYAWGRMEEIPITTPVARVMFRLGWLQDLGIDSLAGLAGYIKNSQNKKKKGAGESAEPFCVQSVEVCRPRLCTPREKGVQNEGPALPRVRNQQSMSVKKSG